MLKEIVDLAKFGKDLIDSKSTKVKGWRKVYQLYCKLDDVIAASVTAIDHYFSVPLDSSFIVETKSFDSPILKWVYFSNGDFSRLDRVVKEFLECFFNLRLILEIYDKELVNRLEFHFWQKSLWCRTFVEVFCSGKISSDGKKIRRSALRLADRIKKPYYRATFDDIKLLLVQEELDISRDDLRMRVVDLGRANITALRGIKSDIGEFIKTNCKIEDLL